MPINIYDIDMCPRYTEGTKVVIVSQLKEAIRHEIDLVNEKRGHQFDDNHAYQAGMFHILTLLEG